MWFKIGLGAFALYLCFTLRPAVFNSLRPVTVGSGNVEFTCEPLSGLFFGDILLSFGDIFVFFGDILLSFGDIFGLMSSEIVIVWQAEEPIRYRPQQTNLMSFRTGSNELSLFNSKKIATYGIISLNLQRLRATCECMRDDDSQTTLKKQRAWGQNYK